jgi:apolipoprotein N-acyltransferase
MQQAVSSATLIPSRRWFRISSRARLEAPSLAEWGLAALTAGLLILSFPNHDSYLLAWVGLVPLLLAIARRPSLPRAFILGWATGSVFFYVSCYWLTYSMIHYGGLPTVVAYVLLVPGALVVGVFPGLFALLVALAIERWGHAAVLLAPVFWAALEWIRLGVTGQLWNAIGYSQAYNSFLIQSARWGGVYIVSFLIVAINAAVALIIIRRTKWTIAGSSLLFLLVGFVILNAPLSTGSRYSSYGTPVSVVAVQPNVPMKIVKTIEEIKELRQLHWSLSTDGLKNVRDEKLPRLVIWPESPMNFTYSGDKTFQDQLATFAKENHTSLLFNSLEPAPADGSYNSALLINEEGRLISQYDKIRLMPFGEYVPLPQWLPGASLITGLVGQFTAGDKYTLMPVGHPGFGGYRAGVFICIESAYPWIARRLTNEGADVLINVSNDGYLGPTAVMRQHLANAIFRAVENGRPVLRVTNSGLSAWIDETGRINDQTDGFKSDVRVWSIEWPRIERTPYTTHGDLFVQICAIVTFLVCIALVFTRRRSFKDIR